LRTELKITQTPKADKADKADTEENQCTKHSNDLSAIILR